MENGETLMTLHSAEAKHLRIRKKSKNKTRAKEPICDFIATLTLREFHALFYGDKVFRQKMADHSFGPTLCEHCAPTIGKSCVIFSKPLSKRVAGNDLRSAQEKYIAWQRKV